MTPDNELELLAHVGGYASIAAVLATAEWAGISALLLAAPIVLGALYLAGTILVERLVSRARSVDVSPDAVATDGGAPRVVAIAESDQLEEIREVDQE